jgi:hypothetical protein
MAARPRSLGWLAVFTPIKVGSGQIPVYMRDFLENACSILDVVEGKPVNQLREG